MFGNKKNEVNYAEEVEKLLGAEAQYEESREGLTEDICPLLSCYGNYAVCSHLVSASYAGCSYDYIYQIDVYTSSTDKSNPAFHGSILRIHDIQTFQKIYCCTEKAGFLSELMGSGWVEQEKIKKLRVWTEGGRLYGEETDVIELYQEWMKERNLCYCHSKEYVLYFDGSNLTIIFFNTKRKSFELKLYIVNSFLRSLEEKKMLKGKGEKLSKENYDFYCEKLAKTLFGEMTQYKKITDGMTSALFPILSFFGDIMDCRCVIAAECAGYKFEYMDYITTSASAWDKKIHHYGFTGNGLIIHGITTPEKLGVCMGTYWENLHPFGFTKKQKIDKLYLWTKERELTKQEIGLAKKYHQWIDDSSLWFHQSYKFMMYFDCNDLIIIFMEPESSSYSLRLEDIKQALQVLRREERKEHE